MAQAMERLFATPKTRPVFPSNIAMARMIQRAASRKPPSIPWLVRFDMVAPMKRALSLALLFVAAAAFAQSKRAFTIEDFYRVKGIADLTLSPEGTTLAFTVSTNDLPHAKRSTKIWIMDAD